MEERGPSLCNRAMPEEMNAKLLMLPLIDIMKLKPSETCFTSKHITDTKKIKDGEKRKRISFLEEEPIWKMGSSEAEEDSLNSHHCFYEGWSVRSLLLIMRKHTLDIIFHLNA